MTQLLYLYNLNNIILSFLRRDNLEGQRLRQILNWSSVLVRKAIQKIVAYCILSLWKLIHLVKRPEWMHWWGMSYKRDTVYWWLVCHGFRIFMIVLEECDILRSKPTVGSVCGGVCRIFPFIKLRRCRVTYKRP